MAKVTEIEQPVPAKAPVEKQAVIQLLEDVGETRNERLVKKFLPAMVISSALHVVLALGVLGLDKLFPTVSAKPNRDDSAVTVEDRKEEPEPQDLTKVEVGLNADIETSIDSTREAAVNVEAETTKDEAVGIANAATMQPVESLKAQGNPSDNAVDPGLNSDLASVGAMAGDGGFSGLATTNAALKGRSGATRDKLAMKGGGTKDSELAVGRGLLWLSKQQKSDGSWVYDGKETEEVIAATGMSLLPFLAAGQTHQMGKDPKDNKYHKTVLAGLKYLIECQSRNSKQDGGFGKGSGNMYAHAIATIALCEAFGMTTDKSLLQKPAQAAINYIMAAQGVNGSWGYQPKSNGDTSIVGWQLQALQSAKLCKDLVVSKEVFTKASRFLDSVAQGPAKSRYGYNSPGEGLTTTAVGLLSRYYVDGWGPQHPGMNAGVEYLNSSHAPDKIFDGGKTTDKYDMYYYYYTTQVMHFFEGDVWLKWNAAMRDALIKLQVADSAKVAKNGSWDPDTGPHMGSKCGRLGTTCMALLTLEVYYRHIPLYRRDNAGLRELERGK